MKIEPVKRNQTINTSDVLERLKKIDPGSRDWISKKLSAIDAENKKTERESAKRIDWHKISGGLVAPLSSGFSKAAERDMAETSVDVRKKFVRQYNLNMWRAIYAYCHERAHKALAIKLPQAAWEKMASAEDMEQKRLRVLRLSLLDSAVHKVRSWMDMGT